MSSYYTGRSGSSGQTTDQVGSYREHDTTPLLSRSVSRRTSIVDPGAVQFAGSYHRPIFIGSFVSHSLSGTDVEDRDATSAQRSRIEFDPNIFNSRSPRTGSTAGLGGFVDADEDGLDGRSPHDVSLDGDTPNIMLELRQILRAAGPLIITFLLQYSLNFASILSIGRLGKTELAASGLANMFSSMTGLSIFQGMNQLQRSNLLTI